MEQEINYKIQHKNLIDTYVKSMLVLQLLLLFCYCSLQENYFDYFPYYGTDNLFPTSFIFLIH